MPSRGSVATAAMVAVALLAGLLVSVGVAVSSAAPRFQDVPATHPFYDEIDWMETEGITTGYSDGTFRPGANVQRMAMAAFLYRYAGEPAFTPPATSPFSDVPTSHPFYAEITWLASTGVTTGYADGTFRPADPIKRMAMAAFLYRFNGKPAFTPPVATPFDDVPTSHPFYKDITWLASTGITTGYADGGFHPADDISRQAMAAFLFRYDEAFAVAAPGAPTGVVGVGGDGQVSVSWVPPVDDGGSPLLSYRVVASPGGVEATVTAPATQAAVTGLANGTAYTFTVKASNAEGEGPASSPSAPVTPSSGVTPPGAPTAVFATGGNAQALVSWTPPVATGGAPITSYRVTASPGGAQVTVTAPATEATVTGLANGTPYTFTVAAANSAGFGPESGASVAVTPSAAVAAPGAPTDVSGEAGDGQVLVSWTPPVDDGGGTITTYRVTTSPGGATVTVDAPTATVAVTGLVNGTPYSFTVAAANASGYGPESASSAQVTPVGAPVFAPPPLDPTVEPQVYASTAFLYSGANPIQRGVTPGTIQEDLASVVRGFVKDGEGAPVQGARVEIVDRPELGETETRSDGAFDMAVNAGGDLLVEVGRDGYLPVQRWVTPAAGEYVFADPIVLTALDPIVTTIDADAAAPQVVRGSAVVDGDGERRATLIVPAGTGASMVLEDGTDVSLGELDVRATEYTVGDDGPDAMPGALPPTSGYTYAVEFSVDEAMEAGATTVEFDKPLVNYTENFLGFPVGGAVPTGWYDAEAGEWVPSDDGRVIAIVSESSGRANLDIDGDGVADPPAELLAELGIDAPERVRLANLYDPGDELWRVLVTHFTPWDHNWPYSCPGACAYPGGPGGPGGPGRPGQPDADDPGDCTSAGSIIGCQEQTLGERLGLAGTPATLAYESDRMPGRVDGRSIGIPLTGGTVPAGVKRVEYTVEVEGQRTSVSRAAAPNDTASFVWDGLDAYGRVVRSPSTAQVEITYVYDAVYREPAQFQQSFGQPSTGQVIAADRAASEIRASSAWDVDLDTLDVSGLGFGGWTVGLNHRLDPTTRQLHLGTGQTLKMPATVIGGTIDRFAGAGPACALGSCGDGGPATEADLFTDQLAVGPDGSVYFHDDSANRIRRITRSGEVQPVAGSGVVCGSDPATGCGTGGPATGASLAGFVMDLTVAPDGTVYLLEDSGNVIRAVGPDGIIRHVAGTGDDCTPADAGYPGCGNGGPATEAPIEAWSIELMGTQLLVAELVTSRSPSLRTIGPTGTIGHLFGCADWADPACIDGTDGADARLARLAPSVVATGPDGSVYLVEGDRIRSIDPSGVLGTIAGGRTCSGADDCGDGGPVLAAGFGAISAMVVGSNGDVTVLDRYAGSGAVVRQLRPGGTVSLVAGGADPCTSYPSADCGDGAPGVLASLAQPACCSAFFWSPLAVGPAGELYLTDSGLIRSIERRATILGGAFGVPDRSGSAVFVFDGRGRHLRTVDALTGRTAWTFQYDEQGLLTRIEDGLGNATVISRTAEAIVVTGPFGQETTLGLDAAGLLATVTDPAGAATELAYHAGGLLASLAEPSGDTWTFTYDGKGRLVRDEAPNGGFTALALTELPDSGRRITMTTAEGRVSVYESTTAADGTKVTTSTDPSGGVTTTSSSADGSTTVVYPDGRTATTVYQSDPRFGRDVSVTDRIVETMPSGLRREQRFTRTVELSDPADPLSVDVLTDTASVNGTLVTTSVWDAATRTQRTTSAEGRVTTSVYDADGQLVRVGYPETDDLTYGYDDRGFRISMDMGDRRATYGYDALGRKVSETDGTAGTTTWTYDDANRVLSTTLPGGGTYHQTYDVDGNRVSLTSPEGDTAVFAHDAVNQLVSWTPAGGGPVGTTYDLDQRVTAQTGGDGRSTSWTWAGDARLGAVGSSESATQLTYVGASARLATAGWSDVSSPSPVSVGQAFTWDGPLRRTTTWNGHLTGSVTTSYDDRFRPVANLVEVGATTRDLPTTWDDDDLVVGVGPFSLTRSAASGRVEAMGDGVATIGVSYDSSFAEEMARSLEVDGTAVFDEVVTRDAVGRIESSAATTPTGTMTEDYAYDAKGRLVTVQRNGAVAHNYVYDGDGNLVGGPSGAATFAADDRPVTVDGDAVVHDADGNRTQDATGTYTWSPAGELLSAVVDGQTVRYAYDAIGRRVARTDDDGTTRYLFGDLGDPFRLTASVDPVGEVTTYLHDDRGFLVSFDRGGERFYVGSDHVGSPRVVTDAAGDVVVQRRYDPFGNGLADTDPAFALPLGFAGGIVDPVTGFVRFGLRDYDPRSGTWIRRDPAGFGGGLNLFAYVAGDPVNRRDPSGLLGIPGIDLKDLLPKQGSVCFGGSAFVGLGGGGELCLGQGGISACIEAGVGFGGGFGPSMSTNPVASGGAGAAASAAAGCGPVGAEVGVENMMDWCGNTSAQVAGEACAAGNCLGGATKWNADGTSEGSSSGKAKGVDIMANAMMSDADFKKSFKKCQAEAKAVAKLCLSTS